MMLAIETLGEWIAFTAMLLLLGSFLFASARTSLIKRKQRKVVKEIFERYNLKQPVLFLSRTYWWPAFKVIFEKEADYNTAKDLGVFEEVRSSIARFYDKKFDPTISITFSYPDSVTQLFSW